MPKTKGNTQFRALLFEKAITTCYCDFCTGVKKHEDNWCSRCANVKMPDTKSWLNVDVCDDCEKQMKEERDGQEA